MCLSRWLYVAPPFHNIACTEKTKKKRLPLYIFCFSRYFTFFFFILFTVRLIPIAPVPLCPYSPARGKKREDLTHDRNPYRVLLLTSLILEREGNNIRPESSWLAFSCWSTVPTDRSMGSPLFQLNTQDTLKPLKSFVVQQLSKCSMFSLLTPDVLKSSNNFLTQPKLRYTNDDHLYSLKIFLARVTSTECAPLDCTLHTHKKKKRIEKNEIVIW